MPPAAAAVGDRAAADHAAVTVSARRGLLFVVPAKCVALPCGIAHQPIGLGLIAIQPFVFVVLVVAAVLAPTALLEHDDGEAGLRELLGHDAARGAGTNDDEIDLSRGCVLSHCRLLQRLPAGSCAS